MTAPETNVDKQARRHRWPLIAFAVGIVVAAGFALYFAGADDIAEDDATGVSTLDADDS
ncbi:MAG: hypothetical protein HLUCCA08_05455 [Rhodobacteraceae bacterium HLUCCA08]|nr:MAG: hypothetical protein HLUCCA08_05455 [Rhodobacteraceae bacterium HLUCCA08]